MVLIRDFGKRDSGLGDSGMVDSGMKDFGLVDSGMVYFHVREAVQRNSGSRNFELGALGWGFVNWQEK